MLYPYPEVIHHELLPIDQARQLPPVPIEILLVSPDGTETQVLLDPLKADLIDLEAVTEYHRAVALAGLQRFQEDPTPEDARKTAEHMAKANVACRFLNQYVSQPPDSALPFPL